MGMGMAESWVPTQTPGILMQSGREFAQTEIKIEHDVLAILKFTRNSEKQRNQNRCKRVVF